MTKPQSPDSPSGYACEPSVPWTSYIGSLPSWRDLDGEVERLLGCRAVAVPSVRVGMLWALEHLGLSRHEDEVLIPRFMGRCILDALNRAARPVHELGPRTRAAVVVHSYGSAPDWERLAPALKAKGIPFMEDAPCALLRREKPAPGSLGKFIALSKMLPILKGGCLLTEDASLRSAVLERREQRGPFWVPWCILGGTAPLRSGRFMEGVVSAEVAYALYPHSPADNVALRSCFVRGLRQLEEYSLLETRRMRELAQAAGSRLLRPEDPLVVHAAAVLAERTDMGEQLAACGFYPELRHVDTARNLLAPKFERAHLLPLHPGVPEQAFARLLEIIRKARK
ncbi:MAG: hypothetical protein ABIJ96_13695 [Elusimicrobiota bacterium]